MPLTTWCMMLGCRGFEKHQPKKVTPGVVIGRSHELKFLQIGTTFLTGFQLDFPLSCHCADSISNDPDYAGFCKYALFQIRLFSCSLWLKAKFETTLNMWLGKSNWVPHKFANKDTEKTRNYLLFFLTSKLTASS